jgi:hypothetical protein
MHVVRHNRPGEKPIALAIENQKRVFDELGNVRPLQPARAQPAIEHLLGRRFRPAPGAHLGRDFRGQAVSQTEGHELDGVLRIEVGEISPRMPSLGFHDLAHS